jgi:hypothetical protein
MGDTIGSLKEIREILGTLPGPDDEAAAKAKDREGQLTKPPGALELPGRRRGDQPALQDLRRGTAGL